MDITDLGCVAFSGLEARFADLVSIQEIIDIASIAQIDAGDFKTFRPVKESNFVDRCRHAAHA